MTRLLPLLLASLAVAGCSPPPAAPPRAPFALPLTGAMTGTDLIVGESLPEIQAVDLDGNSVVLNAESLQGKHTLLIFWSTWCGFCMKELPHEVELAERYQDAGLQVFGVNGDSSIELAREAADDQRLPWANLFEGPETPISEQLGISSWPALLLLDPEGKVIAGTDQLRRIGIIELPDGSAQQVDSLDWTLEQVLGGG